MRKDDDTTINPLRQNALEPRVAALEVGLDRLTADVKDLAGVVRMQGQTVEQEIQKLVVAVTQASGPRKTDWSTIFAGVMLIMAIGSAVYWPLNQKQDYTLNNLQALQLRVEDHQKLDNHPVGAALMQRIEGQLQSHIENNNREFKAYTEQNDKEMTATRLHFHEELDSNNKLFVAQMKDLQDKNDLFFEKLFGRVIGLQDEQVKRSDEDRRELHEWRNKSMGLEKK